MKLTNTLPSTKPYAQREPRGSHFPLALLTVSLALTLAALPCPGAVKKITVISQPNVFLVEGKQQEVSATFDFGAHPHQSETVHDVVEVQVDPTKRLEKEFTDKHHTVGRGKAAFEITVPRAGNLKHRLTEQVSATIEANCGGNPSDCGDVSMTTTTERKVTITASLPANKAQAPNLDAPDGAPSVANFDFAFEVGLGAGTSTSLGAVQTLSESVLLADSDGPQSIYDLEFGVRLDSNQDQEIYVNFVPGTVAGLTFDREVAEIRSELQQAFSYNPQMDQWDLHADTLLFSAHLTSASSSLGLIGGLSDRDPGVEVRSPDLSSSAGLLLVGVLGCHSFKRMATRPRPSLNQRSQ